MFAPFAFESEIVYKAGTLNYLKSLNEKQAQAVVHGEGPLLILAGAGSGKTRVLTHRIAHLIFHHRVDPTEIFAVTFTNKAAGEMAHRVYELLRSHPNFSAGPMPQIWVSTFHSACVRILRSDIHHLGYKNQFTIYDDSDQLSVIKAVMKELNISDTVISPKGIQGRINKIKNEGYDHETYRSNYNGPLEDAFMRAFVRYAEVLKSSSALDFADLILTTVKLFSKVPRVLQNYQTRFRYLLIDEYQDTNRSQYLLMKLLAGRTGNICAVGDEDQSIYGWRGADITNILNFEKDYPNAKIFKLEENYRSTKNIIEAASAVIAHNTERRDKKLWTGNVDGEKINAFECYDEHDEADKVTARISKYVAEGCALNQTAIFYRTNAQSRLLEDMLRARGINYQIFGGLKFYDRLEIKDALAYLKLLSNPNDDVSFRRIINVPTRGIGAVSLEKFTARAREHGVGNYQLLVDVFGPQPKVHLDLGRSQKNFRAFYEMISALQKVKDALLPSDLLNVVLEDTGYRQSIANEGTTESQSRLENLAELRQSIVEFELRSGAENPERPISLEGFLEQIALVSDIDRYDPDAPALKMMTIHMAKGLEFDLVFIVGLEEELFPNIRAWQPEEDADVEEERRLFYVGMTRARKKLNLYFAKNRTIFGNTSFRVGSRFLQEIPANFIEFEKADFFARRRHYLDRPGLPPRPADFERVMDEDYSQINDVDEYSPTGFESESDAESEFRSGSRVVHPIWGEGVVREMLGADKLVVEFPGRGTKKISLKFSQLKSV